MLTNFIQYVIKQMNRNIRNLYIILGIAISISLLVSTSILYVGMKAEVENQVRENYGEKDVMIGYKNLVGYNDVVEAKLSEDDIEYIKNHPYVKQLSTVFFPLFNESRNGILFIGIAPNDSFAKTEFKIPQYDINENEVILSKDLLDRFKENNGKIKITFPSGEEGVWTVKEVLEGKSTVLFNIKDLQKTLKAPNKVNLMLIDLKENADKQQFIKDIKSNIDPRLIIDPIKEKDKFRSNLGGLRNIGIVFGVFILLISTYFVQSILQMSFKEKIQQMAILRSIGTSKKQLVFLVITEALILSLIGSVMGSGLGILIAKFGKNIVVGQLQTTILETPIPWNIITLIIIISILSVLVAGLVPAFKVANIPPIQVFSNTLNQEYTPKRRRTYTSLFFLTIGILLTTISIIFSEKLSGLSFIGSLILLLGVIVGLYLFVKPILIGVKYILGSINRIEVKLAINNLISQKVHTANAAIVIVLGLAIGFSLQNLLGAIEKGEYNRIENQFGTRLMVQAYAPMMSTLPLSLSSELKAIPGVNHVSALGKIISVKTDKNEELLVSPADFQSLMNMGLLSKHVNTSKPAIILSKEMATKFNYKIGEVIKLTGRSDQVEIKENTSFIITDIMDFVPSTLHSKLAIIDWKYLKLKGDSTYPRGFFIATTEKNTSEIEQLVYRVISKYPEAELLNQEIVIKDIKNQILRMYSIFYTAILSIFVVGFLGMYNSIHSNIISRKREYGILRATISTPTNLLNIIIIESLLIGLFSTIIGGVLGLTLTKGLSTFLDIDFIINWNVLITTIVIILIASIGVSLIPAFKLKRLKVVDFFNR
ncbi:hypothetical protein BHF71_01665 [Vulcanibacillus modesticaldus]|uniref:ABC transporter permease n=1 Tax=Vulcanibacillus modesticaldus TaxID=337097 RepID=A0A1D2YUE5_9BACI|nr:FtsX-like permease family protein [Vulcanibacillus modesticaldus]OEF99324.1 hypothetical protein BHF71_01665 [Vulcanibacillus modesticaldus]